LVGSLSHNARVTDLALAHRLADAAAAVSLAYFRRELHSWSKTDGSLATEADVAVEDTLRTCLDRERTGDAVLGEERGQIGSSGRRWIVDGIDGTVDFAAGRPDWGTLIALEVDGRVVCGVCDQPAHQRRYWATRGEGAFCSQGGSRPRALRVSAVDDLPAARSYVPPAQWLPDERAHRLAAILAGATRQEPQLDHPALQVAAGGYDVAVFLLAGPWDLAAPALIVEEAGGRFSDLAGRWDLTSGTAVFSNGGVHEAILRLVSHQT
jgi:histidinol-phosphatase